MAKDQRADPGHRTRPRAAEELRHELHEAHHPRHNQNSIEEITP